MLQTKSYTDQKQLTLLKCVTGIDRDYTLFTQFLQDLETPKMLEILYKLIRDEFFDYRNFMKEFQAVRFKIYMSDDNQNLALNILKSVGSNVETFCRMLKNTMS